MQIAHHVAYVSIIQDIVTNKNSNQADNQD